MSYATRQKETAAPAFYWAPADQIDETTVRLTGEEARHARTVCRIQPGELITVTDGAGNAYDCEVTQATSREVTGQVIRAHRRLGEPLAQVTIAAAVGRPATYDWMVEKSVELGATEIIPVHAAQSPSGSGGPDAAKRRVQRWNRLALGAMKQSLRSVRPPVKDIIQTHDLLPRLREYQSVWLADPDGALLPERSGSAAGAVRALIIIGPEAGFTAEERRMIREAGAVALSLGERRLRAETAAITALTLILRYCGDL